ncbi:MAG TPA: prenyltransferase, partial [bacterium]|nr:prenyltransferase [bacterium]
RAVRPYAYPASVVPALLGAAIARAEGHPPEIFLLILVLAGVVSAHTGGNLVNDYVDFRRGVDRPGTLGGNGVLVEGLMTPRKTLFGAAASFALAAAVAFPLMVLGGLPVAGLALFGFFAAVAYVAPPFGLKYRALGDLNVFLSFGVGITLGSYMIQAGAFSWAPVAAGAVYGLWVVALLHINNTRDMEDDAADGTKTVAGILGQRLARATYAFLVLGSYALAAVLAFAAVIPRGALLCFVTLPLGVALVVRVLPASSGREELAAAVFRTPLYSLFFGLAMTAGVVFL